MRNLEKRRLCWIQDVTEVNGTGSTDKAKTTHIMHTLRDQKFLERGTVQDDNVSGHQQVYNTNGHVECTRIMDHVTMFVCKMPFRNIIILT